MPLPHVVSKPAVSTSESGVKHAREKAVPRGLCFRWVYSVGCEHVAFLPFLYVFISSVGCIPLGAIHTHERARFKSSVFTRFHILPNPNRKLKPNPNPNPNPNTNTNPKPKPKPNSDSNSNPNP